MKQENGLETLKNHFESAALYPICLAVGISRNPRAALKELHTDGFKPSYRRLYRNMAELSGH